MREVVFAKFQQELESFHNLKDWEHVLMHLQRGQEEFPSYFYKIYY
jgi:hypothetical protein